MADPVNAQVGTQFAHRRPPKIAGYVVKGGTWKPTNLLKNEMIENEDEEVIHHSFYGPGNRVECEIVQQVGSSDLEPSQVLDEVATDENPSPGKWLVIKADPIVFGKRALRFSVTLERYDTEDLTLTS